MGATMKKILVILLLVTFLTPGLAQARVFGFEGSAVERATETGFFNMVWNLLANVFDKNGGTLDPSGQPESTTATTTDPADETENGGTLDPSGQPK